VFRDVTGALGWPTSSTHGLLTTLTGQGFLRLDPERRTYTGGVRAWRSGSLFDQCTHVLLDAICLEIARRRHVSLDEARSQHASE